MSEDLAREAQSQAEFEGWIVDRYLARSAIDRETAAGFAAAFFEHPPGFLTWGDPDYDWTRDGANTIADEDMSYWEGED